MDPPRQPHDLQGLLRFAIQQGTPNGEAPAASQGTGLMTEERRRWLEDALKGMLVDVVEESAFLEGLLLYY